jgi:hypothetical protein
MALSVITLGAYTVVFFSIEIHLPEERNDDAEKDQG